MDSKCCLFMHIERCFEQNPCCLFFGFSSAYLREIVRSITRRLKDKCASLFKDRGCLGCCIKPQLVTAVHEPSKGLRTRGKTLKKPSVSHQCWSSSTSPLDCNSFPSRRSDSSIGNISLSSGSNPPEFINHGLLQWNQIRGQWVGNNLSRNQTQADQPILRNASVSYESLLGTNKPFPQPVPLSEMVDFLVDFWDQEGLSY